MKAKYYIYRNTRVGGFSVRYKGKVILVADNFMAYGCTFAVHESGRQRGLSEGKKYVHAFVVADTIHANVRPVEDRHHTKELVYSPVAGFFSDVEGNPLDKADSVKFTSSKAFVND